MEIKRVIYGDQVLDPDKVKIEWVNWWGDEVSDSLEFFGQDWYDAGYAAGNEEKED